MLSPISSQAHRYFKDTAIGRSRASLIVPEPFFVHSDLTTGIQIADLVAYCISWGFRTARMSKPRRRSPRQSSARHPSVIYSSLTGHLRTPGSLRRLAVQAPLNAS
jgi:Protein of unknown function (DUF3800)